MRVVIGYMPEELLEARLPPTNRSVKEYYGAIVEVTEKHAIPEVHQPDAGQEWPDPAAIDFSRDWNALPIQDILDMVGDNRKSVLEMVAAGDEKVTPEVVQRLVRFDLMTQRLITERLFDAQPQPPTRPNDAH